MGLRDRKSHNETQRVLGNEPIPGSFAGVKRWARYLARVPARAIKVKNPERYMSAHARRTFLLKRVIEARGRH